MKTSQYIDEDGDTVHVIDDVRFEGNIEKDVEKVWNLVGGSDWLYSLPSNEGITDSMAIHIYWGADVQDHLPLSDWAAAKKMAQDDEIAAHLEDLAARRQVEQALYAAGIIEDPDMDGGLLG
tara:strand:+ start:45 stop:410 length:366 start_codon:yes stop_codon:yes gene_type:complete